MIGFNKDALMIEIGFWTSIWIFPSPLIQIWLWTRSLISLCWLICLLIWMLTVSLIYFWNVIYRGCMAGGHTVHLTCRAGWLRDGAHLSIRSLCAGYGSGPSAIRGLTLEAERRQKVGICGPGGSGKSTLFLAILRILEPRQGQLLLDGRDMLTIGLRTLRLAVGLVPQDPLVFDGSLRDNLDPSHKYSDRRILEALRCVRLHWLADDNDKGLSRQPAARLCPRGRYLLSLAQVILRQPAARLCPR